MPDNSPPNAVKFKLTTYIPADNDSRLMCPLVTAARSVDQHHVVVNESMGRGCQHKPDIDTIGRTVEVKAQRCHPVCGVGRIDDCATETQRLLRDFRRRPFDIQMI